MKDTIRAIQFGLGPIGSAVARLIAARDGLELVGGVDIDPAKIGKDLGMVIGLEDTLGVEVTKTLSETLQQTDADVVVRAPNPQLYGLREIRVSKSKPIPELIK